jgi:hypothetical protein
MVDFDDEKDDEIMAQLRQVRADIMAEHGNDIHRYFDHLREVEKRDRARGAVYVTLPSRAGRTRHDAA